MTVQINQNINSYNQPQQQQQTVAMGLNAPQIQPINGEAVKQGINNNTALKSAANPDHKWITLAALLPIWGGMAYGMDKFNTACKGDTYEDSLLGKVTKKADKIGHNKFFQSSFMKTIEEKVGGAKNGFFEKFVPKSRILNAIFNTSTNPEAKMVLMMSGGTRSEVASDAASKLENLKKTGWHVEDLNEVLKGLKIDEKEFTSICENSHTEKNIEKIINICEKLGLKLRTEAKDGKIAEEIPFVNSKSLKVPFTKGTYLSEAVPGAHYALDSKVYFSSYANKLKAFEKGETWLGKLAPRALMRTIEGITNGTAGGKLAILMAAFFIADAVKNAIQAPKGDKVSTFAESNINGLGFYLLMPFTIGLAHKLGGLKYLGMTEKQVAEYRTKLADFAKYSQAEAARAANASKVEAKEIKTQWKAERKKVLTELSEMLKGKTSDASNPKLAIEGGNAVTRFFKKAFYWPIKKAAGVVSCGLEVPHGFYTKEAGFFDKLLSSPLGQIKKGAGYPIRLIGVMFFLAPPFVNFVTRCGHVVFGRPKKSILDKETTPEEQKVHPPLVFPNYSNQGQQVQAGMSSTGNASNRNYIPSDENVVAKKENNFINSVNKDNVISEAAPKKAHDNYRYIPSDDGFKPKYNDSQKVEDKYKDKFKKFDNAVTIAERL